MLTAGFKGIEDEYDIPDPIEEDICKMSKKNARGNTTLPDNLYAAIIEVEKSELVKEALGEHIFNKFIEYKKIE